MALCIHCHATIFYLIYNIAVTDRGQPVRNNQHRHLALQAVDCFHNSCLCLIVKRRSCLVKHQNFRSAVKCTRDTDSLSLSTRKAHTRLTDDGIQTFLHLTYQIVKLCLL